MTTRANIELRYGMKTLYAATHADGCNAFRIVPELVKFLDDNPKFQAEVDYGVDSGVDLEGWFTQASSNALGEGFENNARYANPEEEVVIDLARRMLLHTARHVPGKESDLERLSREGEDFPRLFNDSLKVLKAKYGFIVARFDEPGLFGKRIN